MEELLRVENSLELQKLILKNLSERAGKVDAISVTSCHTNSCHGAQLEALERLAQTVDEKPKPKP